MCWFFTSVFSIYAVWKLVFVFHSMFRSAEEKELISLLNKHHKSPKEGKLFEGILNRRFQT